MFDVIIVGAGLSGAVFADRFARELGKSVLIIDKRNHIAGNCFDYENQDGQLMNAYGLHLFHCNDTRTFDYIQRFSKWIRYDHKVVSRVNQRLVSVPVNMETINVICNEHLHTEDETKLWLEKHRCHYPQITNSEEAAKSRVGELLFHTLFESYTKKQWSKLPCELDKSVLERIPVRTNTDTRYFNDKYQVIPEKGYTAFVAAMLNHPLITVQLECSYEDVRARYTPQWTIYTGPIDCYFTTLPKLEYRSLTFETVRMEHTGFYQPHVVINEADESVPYTRTVEYKHLPYSKPSPHTTIVREYSSDTGEPYYPVPNPRNLSLYQEYLKLATEEEKKGVIFVGRLANYKYKNMNEAILDALELFDNRVL